MIGSSKKSVLFREMIALADAARDNREFAAAAILYEAALRQRPDHAGAHMQAGHMFKEARNFISAGAHYRRVLDLAPERADTHLQLGHFYKTMNHLREAETHFLRAAALDPGHPSARENLEQLPQLMAERQARGEEGAHLSIADFEAHNALSQEYIDPTLFPLGRDDLFIAHGPALVLTRLGCERRTRYGSGQTLTGIDAVRGYFVSEVPFLKLEIYLDGELIHEGGLQPAPQRREKQNPNIKKYVFNAWIDFSEMTRGRREILFRGVKASGESQEGITWRREYVIIADPISADLFPESDGIVPSRAATDRKTLESYVNGLPSVVHHASSNSFPGKPAKVLVLRIDQLGDMSVSVPALRRLREILPDAHITGLLSPSNEGLGRSLGLFDEVLTVNVRDDELHKRRVIDREGQQALARMLAPHKFDVVIDLSVAGVSYKLLPLAGAPVMIGFGGEGWMTLGIGMSTHDPKSHNDMMRHSARTRLLIEAFAVWLDSGAAALPRGDLDRASLAKYGVEMEDDFIVLHMGARIKFTRWHSFRELAERLLVETRHKIILMSDEPMTQEFLDFVATDPKRLIATVGKMPFDDFDAFLSFCDVFVGNDSGPKHLAALRGTNVVSIHSSRISWSEWGQEISGVILSRRVPCAGCSIHHDPEECAKDVACVRLITVDEVLREVLALLPAPAAGGKAPQSRQAARPSPDVDALAGPVG